VTIGTRGGQILVLLVVGHVIADFLVQTDRVAGRKGDCGRTLARHGLLTATTQIAVAAPLLSTALVVGLGLVACVHMALDWGKARLEARCSKSLTLFFADQALHLATLLVLWWVLPAVGAAAEPWWASSTRGLAPYVAAALVVGGLVFNGKGGTAIVRALLDRFASLGTAGEDADLADRLAMGRMVGVLERALLYALVLLGHWGALGLVMAAKSVARYPEMNKPHFADYYLVGTLASLVVALASGVVVAALLGRLVI